MAFIRPQVLTFCPVSQNNLHPICKSPPRTLAGPCRTGPRPGLWAGAPPVLWVDPWTTDRLLIIKHVPTYTFSLIHSAFWFSVRLGYKVRGFIPPKTLWSLWTPEPNSGISGKLQFSMYIITFLEPLNLHLWEPCVPFTLFTHWQHPVLS